jgi:hypothetical protein
MLRLIIDGHKGKGHCRPVNGYHTAPYIGSVTPTPNATVLASGTPQIGNAPAGNRYLTVMEAAAYLRVSRWSLYKLVQRRLIPYISLTTSENSCDSPSSKAIVRFDTTALDKWLAKKAINPLKGHHAVR